MRLGWRDASLPSATVPVMGLAHDRAPDAGTHVLVLCDEGSRPVDSGGRQRRPLRGHRGPERRQYLQRGLDSVFEQTYGDIETRRHGRRVDRRDEPDPRAERCRIAYWESGTRRRRLPYLEQALDHVTGDWICFLGSDDRFHDPRSVGTSWHAALALDGGEHRVVYGYLDNIRLDGSVVRSTIGPWTEHHGGNGSSGASILPHPATFHHRSLFERQRQIRRNVSGSRATSNSSCAN